MGDGREDGWSAAWRKRSIAAVRFAGCGVKATKAPARNPLVRADTQGMPINIPLAEQDKCNIAPSHGLPACKGLSPWTPIKYQAVAPIWR